MDLVGPRPERPELIEQILSEVPDYCERLQVLPGVTGLAQINLPADTDFESTRAKLALDLQYIELPSSGSKESAFTQQKRKRGADKL